MKLRTTHNSIRIRIRKSELSKLELESKVEEHITFPNGRVFTFSLNISDDIDALSANMVDDKIQLFIPVQEAKEWINSNQVGIENHLDLPNKTSSEVSCNLHLLIEKDFPCLDRPEEDKSDTFWELAPDTPESC